MHNKDITIHDNSQSRNTQINDLITFCIGVDLESKTINEWEMQVIEQFQE